MNDLRALLPPCPLEYEVPLIPGTHTALVIETHAAAIDWQEKMLPWTLASLINNTDLVMKEVHLYVLCEAETQDRIKSALEMFDLPDDTIVPKLGEGPAFGHSATYGYDSVCMFDINYWAFRGQSNPKNSDIKLPLGHILRHNWGWGVADYSLHPANDILQKDAWVRMSEPLYLTHPDSPQGHSKLANHLMDAGERARWLHAANTAVYGEAYKKEAKNVAKFFFNASEPNWHLDASILQFQTRTVDDPDFRHWMMTYEHLGTDARIALWLLKTHQHAYNFKDSIMMDTPRFAFKNEQYPRLCNMRFATLDTFRHATQQLMGSHLNMTI